MTATTVYSCGMSLDGFIAGPGGDMQWLSRQAERHADASADSVVEDLVPQVGALLVGNRTVRGDDPNRGTDAEGAFGGQWHGPQFVLTHQPPEEPVEGVTFVTDLAGGVAAAREAAGDRAVHVLGAEVARQCLAEGLLDEILVFVAPVLLGDGTRLFDWPGGHTVDLVQQRVTGGTGVTTLSYRISR